jgi:hypothetical protein
LRGGSGGGELGIDGALRYKGSASISDETLLQEVDVLQSDFRSRSGSPSYQEAWEIMTRIRRDIERVFPEGVLQQKAWYVVTLKEKSI